MFFNLKMSFIFFFLCVNSLVLVQGQEISNRVSVVEDCLPKLKIPELSTIKGDGYSLYVGLWPKENLCQAILIKSVSKEGKISAVYSYYGEKEKPSFTALSGVFAEKKANFVLPYKGSPELVYNFASGQSFYKNQTGVYEGWIILRIGQEIVAP